MPGTGAHRWEFVGREPMIFKIVAVLFLANTIALLTLGFFGPHVIPKGLPNSQSCPAAASYGVQYNIPESMCWYLNWNSTISGALLALAILIMIIFRKDVRRVR